jgi:hypothetical protein
MTNKKGPVHQFKIWHSIQLTYFSTEPQTVVVNTALESDLCTTSVSRSLSKYIIKLELVLLMKLRLLPPRAKTWPPLRWSSLEGGEVW